MKVLPNRWLSRIAKAVGECDKEKAAQILVSRFRPENETLDILTRQLGVHQVLSEALPFDGGVYEVSGKRLIKVNSLSSSVRQRFTLAHELGHLILERTLNAATSCTSDKSLERACDKVAAELLMPAKGIRVLAEELGKQSPEKLSVVANHFGVSLQTAAQRLYDLNLWKMSIGMWECDSTPTQKWFVGKRPWNSESPSFAAFDLAVNLNHPSALPSAFLRVHTQSSSV